MCGIIGIASQFSVTDRAWIMAGREAMLHRGPDDAGEWEDSDGDGVGDFSDEFPYDETENCRH